VANGFLEHSTNINIRGMRKRDRERSCRGTRRREKNERKTDSVNRSERTGWRKIELT
jgi:hypothetical protein